MIVNGKYFDDEEFKIAATKYFAELFHREKLSDIVLNRWIEKLVLYYGNNINSIVQKLIDKYESSEYVTREYGMGLEPRCDLYWLLWAYAKQHCKPCKNKRYLNMFTRCAYYIGSYVIQIMDGQGTVIHIEKLKCNKKKTPKK